MKDFDFEQVVGLGVSDIKSHKTLFQWHFLVQEQFLTERRSIERNHGVSVAAPRNSVSIVIWTGKRKNSAYSMNSPIGDKGNERKWKDNR